MWKLLWPFPYFLTSNHFITLKVVVFRPSIEECERKTPTCVLLDRKFARTRLPKLWAIMVTFCPVFSAILTISLVSSMSVFRWTEFDNVW